MFKFRKIVRNRLVNLVEKNCSWAWKIGKSNFDVLGNQGEFSKSKIKRWKTLQSPL